MVRCFLLMLLFATPFTLAAQADIPWLQAILTEQQYQRVLEVKREADDKIYKSKTIATTIELVNLYKDTKKLTSNIAGATQEFKSLFSEVVKDSRTIDVYTLAQLKEINDFLDLRNDWEKGKAYTPLGGLANVYSSMTKGMRDSDGTINLLSTIIKKNSVLTSRRMINSYQVMYYRSRQMNYDYYDQAIMNHIQLADTKQNQANILIIQLNVKLLGKDAKSLLKGYKNFFSSDRKYSFLSSDSSRKAERKSTNDEVATDFKQINTYLDEAQHHRNMANRLLNEYIQFAQPDFRMAQLMYNEQIDALAEQNYYRAVQLRQQAIKEQYEQFIDHVNKKGITTPNYQNFDFIQR